MALQHTSEKALPQQAAVEALQRVSATAASAGSCVLLLAWLQNVVHTLLVKTRKRHGKTTRLCQRIASPFISVMRGFKLLRLVVGCDVIGEYGQFRSASQP